MLQQLFAKSLILLILGGACVSLAPGNDTRNPSFQGVKPGVSDDSSQSQRNDNRRTGREQIAQADLDNDTFSEPYPRNGNFRMGDWDFRENWRYNRDAFYRGETQQQAYREEHPYGPAGIGYDADINYSRNVRRLREIYQKHPSAQNKERLEHYINPYHVHHYEGNYGEGSYNDAYGNRRSEYKYNSTGQ